MVISHDKFTPATGGELKDEHWYRIPEQMVQTFLSVGMVVKCSPDGSHYVKYECAVATNQSPQQGDQA